MAEQESDRIRQRYDRRKNLPSDRYSLFNPGTLFIVQQRERVLLRLLAKHGRTDLADQRILEVGCGTGFWLREFLRYGAFPENLCGIDLLADRVDIARGLSPNIRIEQGDAERLDFTDGSFDIVLQSTVFTSILDDGMRQAVADEMLRVLAPDGIIVWYDFRFDNPRNPDVRGVGQSEIRRLFKGCDFDRRLTTLMPPLARKLARRGWWLCQLLSALPFLRTHYLGVIKRDRLNQGRP
ncbi:MAG: class I SAM-dependent methyltransferase [Candidatus Edwardsbacteria bacterium]|nr:class I SAM-dependent methyltransferase [Candidatus Edwardsbacteria bacterium]